MCQTENTVRLTIPDNHYRDLDRLRLVADKARARTYIHLVYRKIMERIDNWLSDHGPLGAYRVIGLEDNTVVLQPSDEPIDVYWTYEALEHISELFGFGQLLERMIEER